MLPTEARFDSTEVAFAVGATQPTLQNWLRPDRAPVLDDQSPGRGKVRKFTAFEVARLCLAKRLIESGVAMSAALKITAALKVNWESGGHESYGGGQVAQKSHGIKWPVHSLIVVAKTSDWPTKHHGSMFSADGYTGVWLVDGAPKPGRGLRATLEALGSAAAVIVNMGLVLKETFDRLGVTVRPEPSANEPAFSLSDEEIASTE